jgi:AmpD protein
MGYYEWRDDYMGVVLGWLEGAQRCPSPNCNDRPEGEEISLLVIHNISLPPGEFGGTNVRDFFCNTLDCDAHPYFDRLREMQVSAHLLIDRDGQPTQFVSFDDRAWHAGQSCFDGRDDSNDYSIGIELEGTDDEAYTDAQYRRLAQVTQALMMQYPAISPQRIAGHSELSPGRKTDPGAAFDWALYRKLISGVEPSL